MKLRQKPPIGSWFPAWVPRHMQPYVKDCFSFLPMWDQEGGQSWDAFRREYWTGGTNAANNEYTVGDHGPAFTQTADTCELDNAADLLSGLTELTVTYAVDPTGTTADDECFLTSGWNGDSVCLWRLETRSTGTIRVLLDTASGTGDTGPSSLVIGTSGMSVISFRYDSSGPELAQFINGEKDSNTDTAGLGGAVDALSTGTYAIGGDGGSDLAWNGLIYGTHMADRAYTDEEIRFFHHNFFDFWRQDSILDIHRVAKSAAGGGVTTSLVPSLDADLQPQAPTTLRSLISQIPAI